MVRSKEMPARTRDAHPRSEGGTQRLQALSDGVFAIAMTLLVLDLSTGGGHEPVAAILRGQATHLLLYAESMVVLGVVWFGHRNAFEYVRRTDHVHTWLNLGLLATVALVPWTTGLVAGHLLDPLALTVYNASLLLVTALDVLLPLLPISGLSYRLQYRYSR